MSRENGQKNISKIPSFDLDIKDMFWFPNIDNMKCALRKSKFLLHSDKLFSFLFYLNYSC